MLDEKTLDEKTLDVNSRRFSAHSAKRHRKLLAIGAALDAQQRPPTTHEELRTILARRAYLFLDAWRDCPERVCRRHRYCVQPHAHCSAVPEPNPAPLTPEIRASLNAFYRRVVARAEYDAAQLDE
ncbi:MAG TPA: hypothetical protein VFS63_11425 [Pseudolabrys sp.]|jgi:hypothetical protein|nr:hypothetical protein [Pseudolabrys sp.]